MNLYHITQTDNRGYDTYSDAVVAAPDIGTARSIHPDGGLNLCRDTNTSYEWTKPENVTATLIGTAVEGIKQGVICASFHAG